MRSDLGLGALARKRKHGRGVGALPFDGVDRARSRSSRREPQHAAQHLRCSADAVGSTDGTSLTAGRAFQPQHAVAAASANPSTMATGQAPCGLAGDPAEQA